MSKEHKSGREHKSNKEQKSSKEHKSSKSSSSKEKKEEKRKSYANSLNDTQFLIDLQFQNNLPNAPSGPFLRKLGLYHKFDRFAEYKTSTLEKKHVWQFHLGPDCGLNLDFVDQDSILVESDMKELDVDEQAYLKGNQKKSSSKKDLDESDKPWWLRSTTYMENDLFKYTIPHYTPPYTTL